MAFSVELVNVCPRGDLELRLDGDRVLVEAGKSVKVTPEHAGEAPRWRRATSDEVEWVLLPELPTGKVRLHTREHAGHLEVFDVGHGLLAQTENWRKAGDDSEPADPLAPGHPVAANTDSGTETS